MVPARKPPIYGPEPWDEIAGTVDCSECWTCAAGRRSSNTLRGCNETGPTIPAHRPYPADLGPPEGPRDLQE